jgi:hypothetical protein
MGNAISVDALIARNRALIAEAAEVRLDVQQRLMRVRAARGSSRQLRERSVDMEVLRSRAQEAKSDAIERVMHCRELRAQLRAAEERTARS